MEKVAEDEVPYPLRARLAAELDAFRPAAPMPAQARYRGLSAGRSWSGGLRFGTGAVLGAVLVLLTAVGVAGAYRALTPVQTAAPKHVLVAQPSASPSPRDDKRPAVATPPTPTPKPAPPAPAAAPRPEASPISTPEPEGTDSPNPEPSASSSLNS